MEHQSRAADDVLAGVVDFAKAFFACARNGGERMTQLHGAEFLARTGWFRARQAKRGEAQVVVVFQTAEIGGEETGLGAAAAGFRDEFAKIAEIRLRAGDALVPWCAW